MHNYKRSGPSDVFGGKLYTHLVEWNQRMEKKEEK